MERWLARRSDGAGKDDSMKLGTGEWLGACYLTVVMGTLVFGAFGTDARHDGIDLAFMGAAIMALAATEIIGLLDPGQPTPNA